MQTEFRNRRMEDHSGLLMTFAHDLRQPLRSIMMTAQRIQHGDNQLSAASKAKLDELLAFARRQEELIASVVEYDHAREAGLAGDTPLALRLAIQTACLTVDSYRKQRNGIIRFEPDAVPRVFVPAGIARVIEKLLHNSLKFHAVGGIPLVEVEASDVAPDLIVIRIDDNGLGIQPEYRATVFEPFKRLNPASDYPGSGMGLAICARLMESIGGGISIEDRGADPGVAVVLRFPKQAGPT